MHTTNNFKEQYIIKKINKEDILKNINSDLTVTLPDDNNYSKNLIIDYMYYIQELGLLPDEVDLKELIKRLNSHLAGIVFFEEDSPIAKEYGNKFKGFTGKNKWDTPIDEKKTIFVRNSLKDKELYFYHELTHILQTSINSNGLEETGISGTDDKTSLINEAITQYIAEQIYNAKYNLSSEYTFTDGKDERMSFNRLFINSIEDFRKANSEFQNKNINNIELSKIMWYHCINNNNLENQAEEIYNIHKSNIDEDTGIKIHSDLHNYRMYDHISTKFLNSIGLSRKQAARLSLSGQENVLRKIIGDNSKNEIINDINTIFRTDLFIYTGNAPLVKFWLAAGGKYGNYAYKTSEKPTEKDIKNGYDFRADTITLSLKDSTEKFQKLDKALEQPSQEQNKDQK